MSLKNLTHKAYRYYSQFLIPTSQLGASASGYPENILSRRNPFIVRSSISSPFSSRVTTGKADKEKANLKGALKPVIKMAALPAEVKAKLDQIADVKIEDTGRFKYILIKVFAKDKDGKDNDANSKLVVRGRSDCPYHADIYDKFQEEVAKIEGIDDDVLGGGRIERTLNKIFVFGYSQGYGKADHTLTVEVVKKKFPDHDVSWSDDGY